MSVRRRFAHRMSGTSKASCGSCGSGPRGGIARGIYVTAAGRRVVVLHVFAKKSRKTPRRVLATARERMKQVTE